MKWKVRKKMTKDIMVTILNVPNYAPKYQYWVVRFCDGHLWYYGGFDDENRAIEAADFVGNGMVVEVK